MASSHEHSGKNDHRERARHASKRERTSRGAAAAGSGHETSQMIFTLDASTGAVAKIEQIDTAGKRREVPLGETRTLVGEDNCHAIEAALDEAFEAGISSIVEPGDDHDDDDAESEEDTELRRVLLTGIIGPAVRRRLQRRLVQRLALSRTLRH